MYRMIHTFFAGLFAILLFAGLSPIHSEHIAQGDFDKDGDVDFADFIVFSNNFGKPITQQTLVKYTVDTIIVRDTITVNNTFDSEAGKRAGRMLGFWYLNFQYRQNNKIYEYDRVFFFTHIDPEPNEDGEYNVYGKYYISENMEYAMAVINVVVTYSQSDQKYVLTAKDGIYIPGNWKESFDLECKFHFEDMTHPDMTDRLNSRIGEHARPLPEPTAQVEYIVAFKERKVRIDAYRTLTRKDVQPYVFTPVNDGLRRANRDEFMTKLTTVRATN